MKKLISLVTLLACTVTIPVWAVVLGASNFGYGGYPDPVCREPLPPYSNDAYAWDSFKSEALEFELCMSKYVEAANNDIAAIQEQAQAAVNKYNSFVQALR